MRTVRTLDMRRASRVGLEPYPDALQRPTLRGDCLPGGFNQQRPCPFVSCRYHLYLEAKSNGNIRLNAPGREVDELQHSCALDVADDGCVTLEDIGKLLDVSRERSRQISEESLDKIKQSGAAHALLQASRWL